ncbi:MAG TPA: nuclear transport factor 2 family protein, partial [Acidimicrobiales bacterium]
MPLTPAGLRAAVDRYVATINERDPVAIAALFTEDAIQADPASSPPNIGREAITTFFANGIAASE